eukprot:CAMPEP_0173380072 /NCGR_PEP_ID=MMETSP1356-20130122/2836_1 /TAXON_ID=77927 ORGANISM="Hemiselmis virescens, Strain PCC157" /NCGR_SAMPLE_ID=MMETSP1356 /ASSEMBLY_ACC=CAM_ASM_000847 /LENGTH=126 /DNA_ID=CAMNT_0014333559 /DNA_START=358 /DNA_END=738 /DNA_ORIENTATION=+
MAPALLGIEGAFLDLLGVVGKEEMRGIGSGGRSERAEGSATVPVLAAFAGLDLPRFLVLLGAFLFFPSSGRDSPQPAGAISPKGAYLCCKSGVDGLGRDRCFLGGDAIEGGVKGSAPRPAGAICDA